MPNTNPPGPPPLYGWTWVYPPGRYEQDPDHYTNEQTDTGGSVGGSVVGSITIFPSIQRPSASFTYTVYANGIVGFVNKSLGNISGYLWNFGDGTFASTPNALHQYAGSGSFMVSLYVKNSAGGSTFTTTVTVSAIAETVGLDCDTGGLAVQVTDTSTKAGDRLIDFGDGTTSTEVNPYHVYATAGIYTVSITIGGVTTTQQVVIDRGVTLSWQDNSSDETGFSVEHSLNGTDWTEIATPDAGVTTLLVTQNIHGVDPSALNYFRVLAYNSAGDSSYSNTITSQCL